MIVITQDKNGQIGELERKFYEIAVKTVEDKLKCGIHAHTKRLRIRDGMKETVKMFRWVMFDSVMELKSEPFDTMEEAQFFSDSFNDNFLYNSYCKEESGKYYVYSGWIRRFGLEAYTLSSIGMYYEFSNGS